MTIGEMTAADHIRRFVVEELDYMGEPEELTGDLELLEEGVLDSLRIMALVEYLEAAFDIVIDEDDVVAERFETIDAIAGLVTAKQAA
jgi:acyl carrier protein